MGDLDIQFKSFFSLKKGVIKMAEGYKAFDNNFKCLGKQYEPNKTFVEDGDIELCKKGMHFCKNPLDIFRYKNIICRSSNRLIRFAKVQATGEVISDKNKICTDVLKIKDEIDYFELIHDIFKMNKKENYYAGYYYTDDTLFSTTEDRIYSGILFNYGDSQYNDINLWCQDTTIINGISNRNNRLNDSFRNDIINYANNVTFSFNWVYDNNIVIFGQNNTICLDNCNNINIIVLGKYNNIYINDSLNIVISMGDNNYIKVKKGDKRISGLNSKLVNSDELLQLSINNDNYYLYGTIKRRYDTYGKFFKK